MAKLNGLPVYEVKVNEDLDSPKGIDFISLVDYPAIETNFVAMSAVRKLVKFSTNPDKQLLLGPILIPDQPIYRNDEMGEYYITFSAEEIQKLVRKFQQTQKTVNLNYQHQKNSQLKSAVVQEIWLVGDNDKSKDFGFELPKNSAFICAHIGDKKFWDEEIKTKNVQGFSIEGFLDMEIKNYMNNMKQQKFEVHKQSDGGCDVYLDGPVAVDTMVFSNYPSITLVNAVKQVTQYPIWQELIVLEDGTILTLKDSKIIKVETKMANQKLVTAKTDKGVEIKSDSDAFATGVDVYTEDNGTKTPVADGEYNLDNGSKLRVEGGKIMEIIEVDQTMSDEEEKLLQKTFKPFFDKLEKKMNDFKVEVEAKLKNIPGAPSATGKTDTTLPTQLSAKKSLLTKLEILKKKDKELNK
jgi:hypothetical protein